MSTQTKNLDDLRQTNLNKKSSNVLSNQQIVTLEYRINTKYTIDIILHINKDKRLTAWHKSIKRQKMFRINQLFITQYYGVTN